MTIESESTPSELMITGVTLPTEEAAAELCPGDTGCAGASERIADGLTGLAEVLDERAHERDWLLRGMHFPARIEARRARELNRIAQVRIHS